MHPGAVRMRSLADLGKRIAGARVYVTGLNTKNRWAGKGWNRICSHSTLRIDRHSDDAISAQAQKSQRLEKRRMRFFADYYRDRWRAKQAIGFDVPIRSL